VRLGIIAEDDSDVSVVAEITLALLRPRQIGFNKFVGHGSGKLRRKCAAWADILVRQGCPWIVVVHDLDKHNEKSLRADLTNSVNPAGANASVILIPRQEIEAWLLYDSAAIAIAFRERQRLRLPGNPEALPDPKAYLKRLVWKAYRKQYINTLHNSLIARRVDVATLRRSASFSPHFAFVRTVREMLA